VEEISQEVQLLNEGKMIGEGKGINHIVVFAVIVRSYASNSITEVALTLQQLLFAVII